MAADSLSFIDLVALPEIRGRFASGDALLLLPATLDGVIWTNGAGAAVLGFATIDGLLDAADPLPATARRQIAATRGFPAIDGERSVAVRLSSVSGSRVVPFLANAVALPDGEIGILLAVPAPAGLGEQPTAEGALAGIAQPGQEAAIVAADGTVVAASPAFAGFELSREELQTLAADAAAREGLAVKRSVQSGGRRMPVGAAWLNENSSLVIVSSDEFFELDDDASSGDADGWGGGDATRSTEWLAATADAATGHLTKADGPGLEIDLGHVLPDKASGSVPEELPENWYFNAAGGSAEYDGTGGASLPEIQALPPVRFSWRTDAEGRLVSVSPEFVSFAGSGELTGQDFGAIARRFQVDGGDEIAALLRGRDTWSGRTVLWPVAGGSVQVPVDLAALPTYSRSRDFGGFRGFGVVRTADAVSGPEAADAADMPGASAIDEPGAEQAGAENGDAEAAPSPALRAPEVELSADERAAFQEIGVRLKGGEANRTSPQDVPFEAASEERGDSDDATALAHHDHAEAVSGIALSSHEVAELPEPTSDAATAERDAPTPGTSDVPEMHAEASGKPDADEKAEVAEVAGSDEPIAQEQGLPPPDGDVATDDVVSEAEVLPEPTPAFDADDGADGRTKTDTSILDRLPVAVLIHSGDLLHYANPEFLALTDYSSLAGFAEAGGLGCLFTAPWERITEGGERHLRLRKSGGQEIPVEALLRTVPWGGAKALLLVLRQLEASAAGEAGDAAELGHRLSEMRAIIDTATDGVVLIEPDGRVRSISRPAEALFGLDSGMAAGIPFGSLFSVESQQVVAEYLGGLAGDGVARLLNDGREVVGREAKGGMIPLFMTVGSLPEGSGFCAVLRDITQWKRAEEELMQSRALAERASHHKTEFLARVSHEIRTPLNAIIGFSELMLDEKFGPVGSDRYRDYLRDINRSGNHVLDLVNDLLDISKIEAGQQDMSYEAVALNDALAETVATMQPQANRERVIIRSSFASRLPDVVADPRSVRQIALNILSNAIRFTQAGGQVIVSTAYDASGNVVMRVRDTGIGMSQAEIEQALKPFKQINSLQRSRGDGTGLGLPLTKAMVEANRARFAISSSPGDGTMVEVTFPATRVLTTESVEKS